MTLTATSESDPSKIAIGDVRAAGTVGGTVPATLSLTVGAPPFGAFTPGVDARLHGLDDRQRDLDRR